MSATPVAVTAEDVAWAVGTAPQIVGVCAVQALPYVIWFLLVAAFGRDQSD